jgi:hypothetical protein
MDIYRGKTGMSETEIGIMWQQVRNVSHARSEEEVKKASPIVFRTGMPYSHLDFRFLASRTFGRINSYFFMTTSLLQQSLKNYNICTDL